MDIFQAIILGVVEGITEYLPISSTGHLILVQRFMGMHGDAHNAYAIVIQGGGVLAVLGLYRKRVMQMIQGLLGKHATGLRLFINLCIALLPAVVLGLLFEKTIEEELMHPTPIALALVVGGVLMLFVSRWQRHAYQEDNTNKSFIAIDALTWKHALFIGLLQCIAMWPGTSRSMITIVAGMMIGLRPKHSAEFSFLLALPTLGGATVYKAFSERSALMEIDTLSLIVGIVVACVSAAIAIKWLIAYLSKHGLAIFGWYRIALAGVVLVALSNGYFDEEGKSARNTVGGTSEKSSTLPFPILKIDHCPELPVATHDVPSTITGPTAVCQCPDLIVLPS